MESTASSIHSDKAGVKALKDRSIFVWGAMMHVTLVVYVFWSCWKAAMAVQKSRTNSEILVEPRTAT